MIYRKDLFEAAGIEIPTTLDEMLAAGVALQEANADVPNFSGIYLPGRNWYAVLSFLWENGGDIATQEDDQWVGQLDSPGSIAGLEYFKQVFDEANGAPADGDDANDYIAFCNGEVGMMPAPGWKPGQIINPDDGCPDMEANIGVFALPGIAAGATAPVFLGGSNLAIPTNSEHQDLALDLLKIMVSPEYQRQFAAAGTIPALKSELANVDRQRRRRRPGRRPRRTAASCRPARTGPASRRERAARHADRDRPGRRHRRRRGDRRRRDRVAAQRLDSRSPSTTRLPTSPTD